MTAGVSSMPTVVRVIILLKHKAVYNYQRSAPFSCLCCSMAMSVHLEELPTTADNFSNGWVGVRESTLVPLLLRVQVYWTLKQLDSETNHRLFTLSKITRNALSGRTGEEITRLFYLFAFLSILLLQVICLVVNLCFITSIWLHNLS